MVVRYSAAAICTPGLEAVCSAEIKALGCKPKPAGAGTVEFAATARQLYAANVWLRTASRVIVRMAKFRATDFAHLERGATSVDWQPFLSDGAYPVFRISSTDSKLYHSAAIEERLRKSIQMASGDAATLDPGATVDSDVGSNPSSRQLFVVRVNRNTVTISADSSAEPLYLRPWRLDVGPAPLRTTMAAALVMLSNWEPGVALLDPFCGSGSIAIEAALIGRGMPPGGDRSFRFGSWSDFEPGTWASVVGGVRSAKNDNVEMTIFASDRDQQQTDAAQANAQRAGVADDITITTQPVGKTQPVSDAGLIITNPPYGKRIQGGKLAALYRQFGDHRRKIFPSWAMMVVCPDDRLAAKIDRGLEPVASFRHGGLRVKARQLRIPTASNASDSTSSVASTSAAE